MPRNELPSLFGSYSALSIIAIKVPVIYLEEQAKYFTSILFRDFSEALVYEAIVFINTELLKGFLFFFLNPLHFTDIVSDYRMN